MRVSIALALALAAVAGRVRGEELVTVSEATRLAGAPAVRLVSADPAPAFAKEHLRGSVSAPPRDLHLLDDVRSCRGLPMCEARAAAFIGGTLGIGPDTEVIVYDAGSGVNASGTWFFLRLYGVERVRILDGGLAAWKAGGGAVEGGPAATPPARTFVPRARRELVATVDEVRRAALEPARYVLLDARTADEFAGRERKSALASPGEERTVARGGAIPGAILAPWPDFAGNRDGLPGRPTFPPPDEVRSHLARLAIEGWAPTKTAVVYCHVGLGRASFVVLALTRAGHPAKLYVGSWDEWGNDPALPVAARP